ncbi:MAG: type IV pilus assembly protein PilM [Thermodesulfobacteriota bacterium]|nr:type IV pilus assembly protein PilM [Thermodesulfobacteriota bacterium]
MIELLKGNTISIGLDIGSHSVKLVEVKKTSKEIFFTNCAVKDLPLESKGEKSSVSLIAGTVKELFKENNIRPGKATLVVSGPQTAVRYISVPLMPKHELKEAVKWQAKKHIPFPIDTAVVDFQLAGEIIEEGTKKFGIIVAAAERNLIENQLTVMKEAGLKPLGISTIPHALRQSIQRIPGTGKGLIALIDIGASKTSMSILKDNNLKFTREIATAGNAFTRAILEAATLEGVDLVFEGAEDIKKEYGIPGDDDNLDKGNLPLQKISFMMRPVLERLLNDINRSFEFYKNQYKEEEKIDRIFISGGGSELKGLKEYIADKLGIKVEFLTPFKDKMSVFTIASGLAIGKAGDISLLPEEYKHSARILLQKYSPAVLACLVFFLLCGLYIKMNAVCNGYKKELSLKKARLAGLQSANIRLIQLEENRKWLNHVQALIPKTADKHPPLGEILQEISHIVPKNTTLTCLSFQTKEKGKELTLKGITFGGNAEIIDSILEITEGLEMSPFFSNIRLIFSEKNNEYNKQGADFEVVCRAQVK